MNPKYPGLFLFLILLAVLITAHAQNPGSIKKLQSENVNTGDTTYALQRLKYNYPGLTVDLGVGLGSWPLPMDYNNDGKTDLVVISSDVPYDGVFLFENTGRKDIKTGMPVFTKAKRLGEARKFLRPDEKLDRASNVRVSFVHGKPIVLSPGNVYPDFKTTALNNPQKLTVEKTFHGYEKRDVRANQWEYVDFNGDGVQDLVIGLGYWADYRKNAGYDSTGQWTGGPLHGYVYLLTNTGTDLNPVYQEPRKLKTTDGSVIDAYGWPSPMFADFTGNGKLDLLCGEFRDGFTFYKNVGTRKAPLYAPGVPLTYQNKRLTMDLCMVVPVAYDFTGDGHPDLIVGDEAGRVALMKHTGKVLDGVPQFLPPQFFRQEADEVKFGALSTPFGFDWNGDGRDDILTGNTEGQIAFIENLGGYPVKWAEPVLLKGGNEIINIKAGVSGSIQGPTETKWGYTALSVADWNMDALPDLVVNSVWGEVIWFENTGTRRQPKLSPAKPIEVAWNSKTPKPAWNWWSPKEKGLVTQWRTTPVAVDWNNDGLTDLVMLDHEGYLALYRREKREGKLVLLPGERVFRLDQESGPMRLNRGKNGGSGRRKLAISDLDGDGQLDLLVDSKNATIYKNIGQENGITVFHDQGQVDTRVLAGHSTSPAVIHLNSKTKPEILIGAEDGFMYHMKTK